MTRNLLAIAAWSLGAITALAAIPAPNGFPLLLAATVLYGLGWLAYKPSSS